eukprot:scaffold22272_cov66-Phaeocystis_antarctica.AAC.1
MDSTMDWLRARRAENGGFAPFETRVKRAVPCEPCPYAPTTSRSSALLSTPPSASPSSSAPVPAAPPRRASFLWSASMSCTRRSSTSKPGLLRPERACSALRTSRVVAASTSATERCSPRSHPTPTRSNGGTRAPAAASASALAAAGAPAAAAAAPAAVRCSCI